MFFRICRCSIYCYTSQFSLRLCEKAIVTGKHVLVETPMVLLGFQAKELFKMAEERGVILMEANKTAHCPAFNHLIVMIKSGVIGEVVDIEASVSQLLDKSGREFDPNQSGGALYEQGSSVLLPMVKLLGTECRNINIYSRMEMGLIFTQRSVTL